MEDKETKERIVNAAIVLFMRLGTRSVSMDDIARELSISKKTLYAHFAKKEEIVSSTTEVMLQQDISCMNSIYEVSENAMDEFFKISEYIRSMLKSMNPVLLYDLQKFHPKAWDIFNQHKEYCFQDNIIRSIRRGQEEGIFRKDIDVDILCTMRWEQIMLAFNPELFPPAKYDVVQVQLVLFEHFVYGISTLKGLGLMDSYKKREPVPTI